MVIMHGYPGFWLRVEGVVGGEQLFFDNRGGHGTTGTTGWRMCAITAKVTSLPVTSSLVHFTRVTGLRGLMRCPLRLMANPMAATLQEIGARGTRKPVGCVNTPRN